MTYMILAVLRGVLLAQQITLDGGCSDDQQQIALAFFDLYRLSQSADVHSERAAFLIHDADGVAMIYWPRTMQRHAATFRGSVPPNALAIVHTHPPYLWDPSAHDLAEARRLGLPIYVLTRNSVTRANSDGTITRLVMKRSWAAELARGVSPKGFCRADGLMPRSFAISTPIHDVETADDALAYLR